MKYSSKIYLKIHMINSSCLASASIWNAKHEPMIVKFAKYDYQRYRKFSRFGNSFLYFTLFWNSLKLDDMDTLESSMFMNFIFSKLRPYLVFTKYFPNIIYMTKKKIIQHFQFLDNMFALLFDIYLFSYIYLFIWILWIYTCIYFINPYIVTNLLYIILHRQSCTNLNETKSFNNNIFVRWK